MERKTPSMKKRMLNGMLLGGLIACLAAPGARAVEVALKFAKFPEYSRNASQQEFSRSLSFYGVSAASAKRPAGDWKLPKLTSQFPIYYQMSFGGENRLLIFDQKDAQDNYTRLYFDANGNRDLTDDKPIDGVFDKKDGWMSQGVEFPVVEFTLKVQDKEAPYAFQPILSDILAWKKNHQTVMIGRSNACWYAGECELDGKRMRVALLDSNANGRFDEFSSVFNLGQDPDALALASGDQISISPLDGRGGVAGTTVLCNRISIGPKVYDVAVDMAAGKMTLNETRDKLVNIRIPKGYGQLMLFSETGGRSLSVLNPAETMTVPEGKYRLISYSGNPKDEQGNQWSIAAYATGKTPYLAADPQNPNPLRIGAPFTALARVPSYDIENAKRTPQIAQVSLSFVLLDAAGRQVNSLSCYTPQATGFEKSTQSTNMPKEPSYQILDSKGKEVALGTFEYG